MKKSIHHQQYFNQHLLLPALVILAIVIVGGYVLGNSHASTPLSPPPAVQPLPGDINNDGIVNGDDLTIIIANYGHSGTTANQGDLNGDGQVNATDLAILSADYKAIPNTYVVNGQKMAAAKNNLDQPIYITASAAVIRIGDSHLGDKLVSVMDKTQVAASGNKHDYMSVAAYYWPNPNTANGLPYVNRDGQINPEFHTITDHDEFQSLITAVSDLSAAYYFTNDTKYSNKAEQMIRTWFVDSATKMNPNLQYAAIEKGINTGVFSGVIEGTYLGRVIDAVKILQMSSSWTSSDQTGFSNWCNSYYTWLTTSSFGIQESKQSQNHGTWYNVQAASLAAFVGNQPGVIKAVNNAKTLINGQIRVDGYQGLEMIRTRPWNYATLNIEGLISLARFGERQKIDLWNYTSPTGGSIRKAIDFLAPYANGTKTWQYKDLDAWRPWLMTVPLRQAATAYPNSPYTQEANNSEGVTAPRDYSPLLY